jgi:amino acid permease
LGNYILVQSHAVQAAFGGELCLPTAGLIASTGMFVVSQSQTMARLGRTASLLSLAALFIVVMQCMVAVHQADRYRPAEPVEASTDFGKEHSILRKLSALGSIGFAVGSQKLFLNIRHELSDRKAAPRSLAMSLSAFGTFYVVIALAAGSHPPAFLFDAIPAGLNRRIAGLLLWAHVVVSYAINSQAICSSMDRLVWYRVTSDTISASQRWLILSSLMVVAAYTVANAIPFFQDLVALIGALTSVPLTLLLPAIFWRKYMAVPIWKPTHDSLYSYLLIVFAVVFMMSATVGSVYSIQQDWSTHGPPFSCN